MKLSENQKNGFYIGLTVFLGLCFGLVVFFIVQHFKNKNTINCTPNCNGKICGDDDKCGNPCQGTCPSGQSCIGGICSGGSTCPTKCNGINCGDGCSTCTGICPSGQSCIGGICSGGSTCPTKCNGINCGDGCSTCTGSCPYGCGQGTCNPSNEKEAYFFNATSNQYTYTCDNALNLELGTSIPNISLATDTQVMSEFDLVDGLDSCNLGWTVDANGACRMLNPYKTAREGSGSGCTFIPSDPYRPNGVKSPQYTQDKGGLWLYGVKPNLPDCNSTVPAGAKFCVGKYNPNKISKYSKS